MDTNPLDRATLEQALRDFEVPGMGVAVVKDDALLFAAGYGALGLSDPTPVDADTLFAVGSISKSFTSTLLAQLVDAGKLAWDDRVTRYLPDFELYDAWASREITVRDLLVHRSGLRSVAAGTAWYGATYDRAEVLRRLRFLKPVASFRSQYAYQNVMYLAAGEVVRAITGQSWDDAVRERILQPLGMAHTGTSVRDLEGDPNVAQPHARVKGEVRAVPYRDYDNVGAAASINSSVADMARYARMLLADGTFEGRQILSPARVQELFAANTAIPIGAPTPQLAALAPQFHAYGLGWFIRDYAGLRMVSHAGGVDGMVALLTLIPAHRLGVVVLTNQEEALVSPITYQLLDHYLEREPTDWLTTYRDLRVGWFGKRAEAEAKRAAEQIKDTRPSLPLQGYAGAYVDDFYGTATVALEGERLVLRFDATPAFTADLSHWHYDTFRLDWRDPVIPWGLVTFPLDARGKVAALQLAQPQLLDVDFAELDFRRAPDPEPPAAPA